MTKLFKFMAQFKLKNTNENILILIIMAYTNTNTNGPYTFTLLLSLNYKHPLHQPQRDEHIHSCSRLVGLLSSSLWS